ncbi:hypothetical protein TTHERM_00267820 (macronuclear) [Tetrahymena thermophila SB210]|uniref:Uncharacterized protein n=1 Tax=Tetrahymena thermophila (strain SB210) TaxID=312017 RepID=I7M181_TETTS|nr:hypothetical protein TTHERM_00267820 [Tetrahymena thermophila SB210]EAR95672.1 hypothetical protein TTHERM_00267820 [Tetrahymena thermophila SB210]|eukprot:XP_001015917.1 hypothetical protein TTHERM_00267820 [Tetrahymena thermophila SB210]
MGSSCTTAKKSSAKSNSKQYKYHSKTADKVNNPNTQNIKNNLSKDALVECFNSKIKHSKACAQNTTCCKPYLNNTNIMYTSKNQQNISSYDHQITHKEISPQSTNVPNMLSCNTSVKFESPKAFSNGQKTSPNLSRRKMSYIEMFILERKRYMQEKGVYNYTPYTVLPAPKLKKLLNNPLYQKRKSSLAHIPSDVLSNEGNQPTQHNYQKSTKGESINSIGSEFGTFRKENLPAQMPKGDSDVIRIEI